LAEFLKRYRERALAEWEQCVRTLPPARRLDPAALRDHFPMLLDRIGEVLEGRRGAIASIPDDHARVRLDQGFSLEETAEEYRCLRAVLFRLLQAEPAALDAEALLLLNDAIDQAVSRALSRYHQQRSRTLAALERISQEAFASHRESLRDFLRRFLSILIDSTEATDTAVIYLREWDRLVIRAAAGIEAPMMDQFSLPIGDGIAGTVAATRRPYFTPWAARDPNLRNPTLVAAEVRALYAVPLVYGEDLIGVTKMGSRTASAFSDDDLQLFDEMAQRAAVVITHRRLAEEREVFVGVLGHDLRSPLNTITTGVSYLKTQASFGCLRSGRSASGLVGTADEDDDRRDCGLHEPALRRRAHRRSSGD
jgi:GAF domain-containing protein